MNSIKFMATGIVMFLLYPIFSQNIVTNAQVNGHVSTINGKPLFRVEVIVKNTNIATVTDDAGHFQLTNLPIGKLTILFYHSGFKTKEIEVYTEKNRTIEAKVELQEDILGLEEVVITGTKTGVPRKESTTIVNTLSYNIFSQTQSINLNEGLNYCSGLRSENDCQNCGFNQVRINGMEGPYSQIVINSRPVFSGLAGVYGLELIPANMIKKVEIVRGGGSVLYGSSAIAGTINIILKEPTFNTFEIGSQLGLNGFGVDNTDVSKDQSVNFNTSLVSKNNMFGFSLYGFYRDRQAFDANQDDFSELSQIRNFTLGNHINLKLNEKNKLSTDFFAIKESRRGGNKLDEPHHIADISEAVEHLIINGSLNYETLFNQSKFSVYFSGQGINRDSYYGANQSLKDYGNTKDFTYTVGTQYDYKFENTTLVTGFENTGSKMRDKKLGYIDFENAVYNGSSWEIPNVSNRIISNQAINTTGIFIQYEQIYGKFKISKGLRFDHYEVVDKLVNTAKIGNILVPKISFKYDVLENLQTRISYSQGYRSPQIFDEDLHILTSGVRQVIHKNDPNLKQENSHSYMMSFDFNKQWRDTYFTLLVEGFYTNLNNAFVNLYGEPDSDGVVVYTRTNAEKGAKVQGVNLESTFVFNSKNTFKMGFTLQKSRYDQAIEFDEKSFLRTPNTYGFILADLKLTKRFSINSNINYTGKMLIPYFGTMVANTDEGELRKSPNFYDFGIKAQYDVTISDTLIRIFGGVKNIFNSYQSDFDRGIERDPGYIYGPGNPRMLYVGIKFGNDVL